MLFGVILELISVTISAWQQVLNKDLLNKTFSFLPMNTLNTGGSQTEVVNSFNAGIVQIYTSSQCVSLKRSNYGFLISEFLLHAS